MARSPKKRKKKRSRARRRSGINDEDNDEDDCDLGGADVRHSRSEGGDSDDHSDSEYSDFDPGVPLNVQIPGVATAATEASSDGVASSPASLASSSPNRHIGHDDDAHPGDDRSLSSTLGDERSVTSNGTEGGKLASTSGSSADGEAATTIRSATGEDNSAVVSVVRSTTLEPPQTPSQLASASECQTATPARCEDGMHTFAALSPDVTPRASCRSRTTSPTEPMDHLPLPASPDDALKLPPTLPPVTTSGSLRPALGDDSVMLQTMLTLPSFRPIGTTSHRSWRRKARHPIPEHEEIDDEAKEEVMPTSGHDNNDIGGDNGDGTVPSFDAEDNQLLLQLPIPLVRRESYTTVTSEYTYDDDSTTGDNVCPICLCGYKVGDVLVNSKYCVHVFHKVRFFAHSFNS